METEEERQHINSKWVTANCQRAIPFPRRVSKGFAPRQQSGPGINTDPTLRAGPNRTLLPPKTFTFDALLVAHKSTYHSKASATGISKPGSSADSISRSFSL